MLETLFGLLRRHQCRVLLRGEEDVGGLDQRAQLLRPRVLLIDGPGTGLSPIVVGEVFRRLRWLADAGTTVPKVAQNVRSARKIADDAIALESGCQVLHRPAAELLAEPHIERQFPDVAAC